MKKLLQDDGLEGEVYCDSAGTSGFHIGAQADKRMLEAASLRNYHLTSRSRKIAGEDFSEFDYLIAMDDSVYQSLHKFFEKNEHKEKIVKMTDFSVNRKETEVPDPYFGGMAGFDFVLDILEDSCGGLLKHIKLKHNF